jgi:hypothetical protein
MAAKRSLVLLAATALSASLGTVPAFACGLTGDRPGTPNEERAVALSPTSIRVEWTNRMAIGEYGGAAYIDISVTRDGQKVASLDLNSGKFPGATKGSRSEHVFERLEPGKRYCFRIWARTSHNGCRSLRPTNPACADTPPAAATTPKNPDTCLPPYVWRAVNKDDRVCVTTDVRKKVRDDNALAARRRVPPTKKTVCPKPPASCFNVDPTCKPGFVWRSAVPGDLVCVEPEQRKQAAIDNAAAAQRRVGGTAGSPIPPPPSSTPAMPAQSPKPSISVEGPTDNAFVVKGSGFTANTAVTIRVADDALTNAYIMTIGAKRISADAAGRIDLKLVGLCKQKGKLHFSAIDVAKGTAHPTGISNYVDKDCP